MTFLQTPIFLPFGWRILQTLSQRQRTMTNTSPPLLLVRHKQQAVHLYHYKILRLWLVIRRSHYEANWCNHERIYSVIRRTIRKIWKTSCDWYSGRSLSIRVNNISWDSPFNTKITTPTYPAPPSNFFVFNDVLMSLSYPSMSDLWLFNMNFLIRGI